MFEKVGVHVLHGAGEFAPEFRGQIPGSEEDPRFWRQAFRSSPIPGIRTCPTVHMNNSFRRPHEAVVGGGADLTPVLDRRRTQQDADAQAFHTTLRDACNAMVTRALRTNTKPGATSIFS